METTFSFLANMTDVPDKDNIWSFYTGKDDYKKTRSYKNVLGFNETKIVYILFNFL